MNSNKKIFFQSSLPRAGSTLLQNILGQNPEFYVTPTSGVLELLFAARANYTNSPEFKAQDAETMKAGWLNFCKEGMQGFYKGVTDKPYVMDKSRGWGIHYDFLSTFIDKPKIVCMVRDPRAIFSSLEKNFRKSPEKSSDMVNWSTGQGTNIEGRVNMWAKGVPIGIAMTRLKEMIDRGFDKNILFIRFEDLTKNPKKEIEKVYEFLELKPFKHDFSNIEQITVEDDEVYGAIGDHIIRPEIKEVKLDYNEILGSDLSQGIRQTYAWFYQYFGYR